MADVTISQLTPGVPTGNNILPYSTGSNTLGVPVSAIFQNTTLTTPSQPFLYVNRTGQGTYIYNNANVDAGQFTTIPFGNIVQSINSNYNPNTGLFTAPVAGVYLLEAGVNDNGTAKQLWPVVGGNIRAQTFGSPDSSGYTILFGTTIVYLNANQTLGVRVYSNTSSSCSIYENSFHTFMRITLLG